ncbi:ribonuclease HIII [Bacillus sp. BR3(2024)]|uniref:ribonuclease HIII n=1 Tax=Bacillus sp. BR3(2024) TaxID=3126755 RepID=UPI003182CBA1
MEAKDKYELFTKVKGILETEGFKVSNSNEINYGLQFQVKFNGIDGLIRIYQSKKGTRLDLSQIKDSHLLNVLQKHLLIEEKQLQKKTKTNKSLSEDQFDIHSFRELIGTDESGKGDYFGPLVVAGAYINDQSSNLLREIGVTDSKKISDKQIQQIAPKIKRICPYSVVVIGNEKYNELQKKMGNLNKLLAWGHARVIENLLGKVDCHQVLSDQFGDEELIKKALLDKGKKIKLYQRTKAEENIAVAAASILARYEYIKRLETMSLNYNLQFPKGASTKTIQIAKEFLIKYGEKELSKVSKLHFKTTEQVKG